ncbi:MAG: hypothetical protein ABRQ37_12505 [Candidatus Eremiobacterota bacterium]
MEEHSEYSFDSYMDSNVKYWLLGSFISINVGWAILILICISVCFFPEYHYIKNSNITFVFLAFGPFTGALVIKFIKKDIPWYFYITTGLIYVITFFCFIIYIDDVIGNMYRCGIKMTLCNLSFHTGNLLQPPLISEYGIIVKVMIVILSASFLGGFIVDIYRYVKCTNSDRNYYL